MSYRTSTRPFGVSESVPLSVEQFATLQAIEDYDLWFVAERLERKQSVPVDLIDSAITEFKKYMALIALGYRGIAMASREADEVWHNFILFTREYHTFCQSIFGEFIHHVPKTSRNPLAPTGGTKFIEAYRRVFGELHPLWRASASNCIEIPEGQCSPTTNCQEVECCPGDQIASPVTGSAELIAV